LKHCRVACDTAAGIRSCSLTLPDDADVRDALCVARELLGEPGADWEQGATGIYGRLCNRDHVWTDGDRIELYRPLQQDPRAGRRARAKA
jgi:putative ubiquitin-RnfH superfamily antitoxin RatB of RatAB toxin-antitoxin module